MSMRDPVFNKFIRMYPDEDPVRYGYFDDEVESYDWRTGVSVSDSLLAKSLNYERPAVLVMTGALDPFHEGHAEALRTAKNLVQRQGYQVVYTHVIPDSSVYARMKRPMGAGGDEERKSAIEALGYVCDDACMRHSGRPNYTSILLYVQKFWRTLGVNPVVFNVIGSDNALFAEVMSCYDYSRFGSVIFDIDRPNHDDTENLPLEDKERNILVSKRSNRRYASLSSTLVRERFGVYNRKEDSIPVMFIKNDLDYYHQNKDFHDDLIGTLKNMYLSFGYKVVIGYYRQQVKNLLKRVGIKYAQEINLGARVVSLDRNIGVHDKFLIHRIFQDKTFARLGYIPDNNLQVTPGEKIILIDDDMDTGGGMLFAQEVVEGQEGEVIGRETIYKHPFGDFDVLDASDVTTIKGTGLMVQSEDLTRRRIPYLRPWLDLCRFSSVPDHKQDEFTDSVVSVLKRYHVGMYDDK